MHEVEALRHNQWMAILFACNQLTCYPNASLLAEALLETARLMKEKADPIYGCSTDGTSEALIDSIMADLKILVENGQAVCDQDGRYTLTESGLTIGSDALIPGRLANISAQCAFRRNQVFSAKVAA